MEFTVSGGDGRRFEEGVRGQHLMRRIDGVTTVLEACFGNHVDRVLLYPEDLTEQFFDLSTGETGAILQAFRNGGIRIAVVCSSGKRVSRRFGEVIAEESRGPHFRLFDDRDTAHEWLRRD